MSKCMNLSNILSTLFKQITNVRFFFCFILIGCNEFASYLINRNWGSPYHAVISNDSTRVIKNANNFITKEV